VSVDAVGTVRRGRGARKVARQTRDIKMLPALKRQLPLTEPMTPDQIEKIDAASMNILENVGVQFRDNIALADWKAAGAKVVGEIVYLDRHLVRELIATIPETFTYHARNTANSLPFGSDHGMFIPMTGAPFLRDLDDVRRNPTLDDLANFHKLSHMLPALHSSAHHIVEPYDHPISQRHLRITYSSMKYSDKTFMGMTTSPKNAEDVMDMCAICLAMNTSKRTLSSPAIATAIHPWCGMKPCWARCGHSVHATSRSCVRPLCWAVQTPLRAYPQPWRN
jgi:trimethylamine--corrinoid protein Co-methyltransferase